MTELTAAECHFLKSLVLLKQEQEKTTNFRNIDLSLLYGKLNVLWGEARKEENKNAASTDAH